MSIEITAVNTTTFPTTATAGNPSRVKAAAYGLPSAGTSCHGAIKARRRYGADTEQRTRHTTAMVAVVAVVVMVAVAHHAPRSTGHAEQRW
jgi:hypothetical protein